MKKVIYLFFAAIFFMGCSKDETDLTFNATPEERMNEKLAEVKSILTGASNGWVVGMGTGTAGGFGFYMNFAQDDKVSMYSDVFDESTSVLRTSTYRVKWGSTASLIFDTYNYLTFLQDPTPGVAGGVAGKGYEGDIEFNFDRVAGDTVFFVGKKYLNPLVLIKASVEEKNGYEMKSFINDIENVYDFFSEGVPVVNIDGAVTEIDLNIDGKSISFSALLNNSLVSSDGLFYNVVGEHIRFLDDITFNNHILTSIVKEPTGYKLLTKAGTKFDIYTSQDFILPPEFKIGTSIVNLRRPGPYGNPTTMPMPTWSVPFVNDWNRYVNLSKTGGYNLSIGNTAFVIVAARNEITVTENIYQVNNQGVTTGSFIATYSYRYTLDKTTGIFRFVSLNFGNNNGQIIVPYMNSTFFANMREKDFKLSFVNDPTFGKAVKFTQVDNPNYFFTWLY